MYTLLKEGDFCCCSKVIIGIIELNHLKGLSSTSLPILKKTDWYADGLDTNEKKIAFCEVSKHFCATSF